MTPAMREVYEYIKSLGEDADVTGGEINDHFQTHYREREFNAVKAIAAWRTHLNELEKIGLLVEGNKRACRLTGRPCKTFRIAPPATKPQEPKPNGHRLSKTEYIKDDIRHHVRRLIKHLTTEAELDESDRQRFTKEAMTELLRVFAYLQAGIGSARRRAANVATMDAEQQAALDRTTYERALKFFNVRVKKDEFASERQWIWLYRQQMKVLHPDQNGGVEHPNYARTVQAHRKIRDYEAKYKPKRTKKETNHAEHG